MLEPYDGKLSRTVLRRESGGNTADPADYSPLVNRLKGQVIKISPNSTQFINPMDINANYSEEDNPLSLKADFILSDTVSVCTCSGEIPWWNDTASCSYS